MTEPRNNVDNEMKTQLAPFGNDLSNFVQEIENAMKTWSTNPWMPSLFSNNGIRLPLCQIVDKGNRYELKAEIPGMGKENVKIHAQSYSVELNAEKKKITEGKNEGSIYTERSENSFYRQIQLPDEIVPVKVKTKVSKGILFVDLPKKNPRKNQISKRK